MEIVELDEEQIKRALKLDRESRIVVTDVCVPMSWLADCIVETKRDLAARKE